MQPVKLMTIQKKPLFPNRGYGVSWWNCYYEIWITCKLHAHILESPYAPFPALYIPATSIIVRFLLIRIMLLPRPSSRDRSHCLEDKLKIDQERINCIGVRWVFHKSVSLNWLCSWFQRRPNKNNSKNRQASSDIGSVPDVKYNPNVFSTCHMIQYTLYVFVS